MVTLYVGPLGVNDTDTYIAEADLAAFLDGCRREPGEGLKPTSRPAKRLKHLKH